MTGHILAPVHIQPLLEIHCLVYKKDCYYIGSNTCTAMVDLVKMGFIEPDPRISPAKAEPHGWQTTEKGRAWIEAMQRTPVPIQRWVVE